MGTVWFYLLLSALIIVMTRFTVVVEESITLDKLGDAYREYMNVNHHQNGSHRSRT